MNNLKKLAILLLIIIKTLPLIVKTYKQIYDNVIKNEEKITEISKKMVEADKVIKTKYVDKKRDFRNNIKAQELILRNRKALGIQ